MDTIKFLLGSTLALLLGAIGLSIYQMRGNSISNRDSGDDISKLKLEIQSLKTQADAIKQETELRYLRDQKIATPAPTTTPAPDESEKLRAELATKEAELKALNADKEKAQRDAKTFRDEAGLIAQRDVEKNDTELRRARIVKEAMLVARVKEYVEQAGFATLEIIIPQNVQPGIPLAVRKGTGISGELEVSSLEGQEAIANLKSGFNGSKPQPGDEVIISPQ